MIKYIMFFIFMIALNFSARAEDYDFRKTQWGMTILEVKQTEPVPPIGEQEFADPYIENLYCIVYYSNAFNRTCKLSYTFENNRLVSALYIFDEKNNISAMNLYKDITTSLYKKYKKINEYNGLFTEFENSKTNIVVSQSGPYIMYSEKTYHKKRELKKSQYNEE